MTGLTSKVSGQTALGRVVRLPLRLIPRSTQVRILSGPLKGERWIVGSSTHGCWTGTHERDKLERFAEAIRAGAVVYDIGAHVGQYTLLAARRVGPEGRVVGFEPVPRNLEALRTTLQINDVTGVQIIEAAVSDREGTAHFQMGPDAEASGGRIADQGPLEVATIVIDDLVSDGLPAPDVIKMDIEGGEGRALAGMRQTLADARPVIFLATHGDDVKAECVAILEEASYRLESLGSPHETLATPPDLPR